MYMFEVLHCIFVGIVVSDRSLIGLSLTYTISLTGMFQYVIRQSAEVENLVSICSLSPFTYLTSLYILSDDIL